VAIANAPTTTNSGGIPIDAPEINVLWSALSSGDMGLDQSEKEYMMSMIGTTVIKRNGSGTDAVTVPFDQPKLIALPDLIGDPTNASETLSIYSCDDSAACLNPTKSSQTQKSFSRIIYEKATNLQQAIINRTAPDYGDLKLLTVTTSIPIYKIIKLSTVPSMSFLGNDLIQKFSTAVALEIASYYVEDVAHNVDKLLKSGKTQGLSAQRSKALDDLQERLRDLRDQVYKQRVEVYQKINQQQAMIAQIEQLERSLYGNLSAQLAANMRFGR
jgi:hypothetical protein